LFIVFRSVWYASVTIIPVVLVVIWTYGLMGLLGLSLNFITATIAAVSVGAGIDYSVHIAQRFRQEKFKQLNTYEAVKNATVETGFALFVAAVSSVIGFVVLSFAPMPLFATYGVLGASMIGFSFVLSLLILPALLSLRS